MAAGLLGGCAVFCVRMYDPKRMNLPLIRFNRWLIVVIAAAVGAALLWTALSLLTRERRGAWRAAGIALLSSVSALSLMYAAPQVIQYTREFVYFGEAGLSTQALLRAVGFALGLLLCFLLALSAYKVSGALKKRAAELFLCGSLFLFFAEYAVRAVASLQRLKILPLSDFVFQIMVWGDEYENLFLFGLLLLGLVMLTWVILTHLRPSGEFPNRALLRKEKARLRNFRRWSWSLFCWGAAVVLTVTVLHYYDTKPPAEVQPEPYELYDGVIEVDLTKVSDGHLHKFSYVTSAGRDVRFLIVKKPLGTSYGVGLDACEICGIAGYFERGADVVCRRCDVVMNKNTIGFKGGCNPIPFEYDVRGGKIFIETKELERHEMRFR